MNWITLENAFLDAWRGALTKRKFLMSFLSLSLCGVFVIFCKAVALGASSWVRLSLLFIPFFLSSGFLLILGVLLIKMHIYEKKGTALSTKRLLTGSITTAMGTSYLSFISVAAYLFLWIALGLFFLLREIPYMGPFFNVILAFGPFLLIFVSLLLCLSNLLLLFFVAPIAAQQTIKNLDFIAHIWKSICRKPFLSFILFFIGLLPSFLMGSLLSLAAFLTNISFSLDTPTMTSALAWFFVMLPFCALLAPAVLFFFHFAAESYQILEDRSK